MKIAVCGCSWSSRDPVNPGFEFGQIVADYYGATDYRNYAIPGCSNFIIALQVEQALNDFQPDLIIINATTVTREDFKITNSSRYSHVEMLSSLGSTLYSNSIGSIFNEDINNTLSECHERSSLEEVFTEQTHQLYKQWFLQFYDADIVKHKQYYLLQSVLYKLQIKQIPFLFSPNTFEWTEGWDLKTNDPELNFTDNNHIWDIPHQNMLLTGVSDTLSVSDEIYGSWENSPGTTMSNHLAPECHQAYAAHIITHLNSYKLINNTVT